MIWPENFAGPKQRSFDASSEFAPEFDMGGSSPLRSGILASGWRGGRRARLGSDATELANSWAARLNGSCSPSYRVRRKAWESVEARGACGAYCRFALSAHYSGARHFLIFRESDYERKTECYSGFSSFENKVASKASAGRMRQARYFA
jgi:hypothetical protein